MGEQSLTYQDLQPRFLRELHHAGHEQLPELRALLEESFLQDEAGRWYVPDPSRSQDLERLRDRALLREFRTYVILSNENGFSRTFRERLLRTPRRWLEVPPSALGLAKIGGLLADKYGRIVDLDRFHEKCGRT